MANTIAQSQGHSKAACCAASPVKENLKMGNVEIPDILLTNQEGQAVQIRELIKGKVVAMNFIFTTCTTICPPMGANFTHLKKLMEEHVDKDLVMLSVSLDPVNDTPERLKLWSDKFDPGTGWTLLTGEKSKVEELLKALKVFTPIKEEHAPVLLMGTEGKEDWIRANGLAEPTKLADALNGYLEAMQKQKFPPGYENDLQYFSNTLLVNQHGEALKFYEDLLMNKVVIINPFFAECKGSCPVMHGKIQEIQKHFKEQLANNELALISITVDPDNDKPDLLKAYAERFNAGPGWHFLSGDNDNVNKVLKKLGKNVENREAHDSIFLIGNVNTKLWKKANGLGAVNELLEIIEGVLNDVE